MYLEAIFDNVPSMVLILNQFVEDFRKIARRNSA